MYKPTELRIVCVSVTAAEWRCTLTTKIQKAQIETNNEHLRFNNLILYIVFS
jgi:hypothetical protein